MGSFPTTMSSSDIPLKLAGTHLGLPDDASRDLIPQEYLTELSKHLAIYPDDTKFELSSQPNRGFGKVTCLEDGCDRFQIELQHNPTLSDGGRKIGIGSLSTYRAHIAQHPTHSRSRLVRIKTAHGHSKISSSMSLSRKGSLVKNEPVDLNTSRVPLSSSPDLPHNTISLHQPRLSLVKAEPKEDVFEGSSNSSPSPAFQSSSPGIRKRSPSLDTDNLDSLPSPMRSSGSIFPPAKKLKTELTSSTPLGVSTNMVIVTPTGVIPHAALDVDDIQGKIDNLQAEIFLKQDILDGLLRQDSRTPAELMLIQKHVDELTSLDLLQGEYRSHLPVERNSFMSKVGPHHSFGEDGEIGHSALPWYAQTAQAPLGSFASSSTAKNRSISEPVLTPLAAIPVTINPDGVPPCVPPLLQVNAVAGPSKHALQPAYIPGHTLHNSGGGYEDEAGDAEMGYAGPNETAKANEVAMQFAGTYIPNVAPIVQDDYDEDGNFRGRGKDHFQGPIAKPDDIGKFLVEAGNSESFDHNATVEAALNKLGLPTLATPLPGMEVALMPHQVIGVAWMVEKENSNLKGGCLADEMGLGKTVQIIALMMKNRPDDKSRRTTLILAPTALLDQWKMEIEVKTNIGLKVLIYHGPSKLKRAKDLLEYDVVLTTFQTMALEWPDIEQEEKKKKKAKAKKDDPIMSDSVNNENTQKKDKSQEAGLLFQIEFFRIVLDEAQGIKNKKTRVSRAVTALKARYRWCLTGTPIINGLSDTYPYIRFLQIRPWHDFVEFHGLVGKLERKNPQLAITRLQAILNIFVLRRKKNSQLDGKVLIDLPTKEITLQRLEFTEEEREIYDAVEKRMQTQFNRFLKAGTVLKNYHHVLVLLLRLRQCCAHPSLIQEEGVAFVAPDELDDAGRVLKRARELVSEEFVTKLKTKFREAVLERMRAKKESEDATFETDDCPICYDNFTNAVITSCGHSFCKECIHDVFNAPFVVPANEAGEHQVTERPCPSCRTPISKELLFEQAAFMPTDEELKEAGGEGEDSDIEMDDVDVSISKGKGRAKETSSRASRKVKRSLFSHDVIDVDASDTDDENEYDDDDMSDFIVECDDDEEEQEVRKALKKCLGKPKARVILDSDEEESDEEKEVIFGKSNIKKLSPEAIKLLPRFLPSTKMKYMMEHIRRLFLDRPEEKILVISQWTSCLSLVSQYLTENQILHVKYQGDMNRNKRDAAVRSFMSKDKARVMLLSLKCGGVGLNLTRANNVISLDLGWSQAIEDQAFDRVHRLGQLLPVKVHRLVVDRTIEARMLVMQERKQLLADGSLGEGTAKKIRRMTVKQLAELFGLDGWGRLLNNGKAKDIAKVEINNANAE